MEICTRSKTRRAKGKRLRFLAAMLAVLFVAVSASCSRGPGEVPVSSNKKATSAPSEPGTYASEPAASTRAVAVGDSVRLPAGVTGTVGLWLMNPGTCEKDVTYESVESGATAVVVDLCQETSAFLDKKWYAKLRFPERKLSQGTDNMWLPVNELTLVSKAKAGSR